MSRAEGIRRLQRIGTGRFVCDQRAAGGKLWRIERHGRDGWIVYDLTPPPEPTAWEALLRGLGLANPPAPPPGFVLEMNGVRPWVNDRATELEREARGEPQEMILPGLRVDEGDRDRNARADDLWPSSVGEPSGTGVTIGDAEQVSVEDAQRPRFLPLWDEDGQ